MIEIEKYKCDDGNEARARERYWYEQLQATLNMIRPLQTDEEIKQYNTKRKNKHNDCLCGGKYLSKNKAVHNRSQMHQTFLKLQQMADQQMI